MTIQKMPPTESSHASIDECEKLGKMPGMGHHRNELIDNRHKFWSVWAYLVVYRWQVEPIQVISIVHGARDLEAFFASRG
jgi:antitoxin ParD1/3/4/toxin ParE1/3/4